MSIHFLSPNPEQKQTLDELEKLLGVLKTKPNKKLKQDIRFLRNFTKALLTYSAFFTFTISLFSPSNCFANRSTKIEFLGI